MTSAVAYLRVSGQGQVEGDGFPRQLAAVRAFASAHDYELTLVFREEAVSGKAELTDRPAFQEMVSTLLTNCCRTIIVEGMDRLAREYRIQEQLIIYLASKGIDLIAANTGENVTQAMMGDPMRRALVQIQGVLAELDKNMIVAKLLKARKRKRENGERCEGRKPYGFREGERDVISQILAFRQQGTVVSRIAALLNQANIPTRDNKQWSSVQVKRILDREAAKQLPDSAR